MSIEIVNENTSVRKGFTHKTLKALGIGQKRAEVKRQPIKVRSDGFYMARKCSDCGVRSENNSGVCSSCGSFNLKNAAVIKFYFEETQDVFRTTYVLAKNLDICSKEDVDEALERYKIIGYDTSLVERYRGK